MKTWTLIILTVFGFQVDLNSQSLDDYLKVAAENNSSLKAEYKLVEATLQRITQVNSLPDPNLSLGYFISSVETRVGPQRARASLTQMFPWFGTLKAKGQVAALEAEVQYQKFTEHKKRLIYRVKQAYYPLYRVKKHLGLQLKNLRILESYKRLATTNFSNGKGKMEDVLRSEIMIESIKTDILILKDQITPLEITFNRLLNREDTFQVNIPDTISINKSSYIGINSFHSTHPQILVLEKKLSALQAQELVEQKKGLPQIGLGIDYALTSRRTDIDIPDNGKDAFMVMATVKIPIYREKYKSAVEENRLLQESTIHRIQNTKNDLKVDFENSMYKIEQAIELDSMYQKQLKTTSQVINLLYATYSNSGRDFEEILRMQQQLLKYEMALVNAKVEYHIAIARLTYLTSKS